MLPPFTGSCGAAYLLRNASATTYILNHPFGTVQVRAGAPFVTMALRTPVNAESVRSKTWMALQEAMDVHAARTRNPLATQSGDSDVLTWIDTPSGYDVTYYFTSTSQLRTSMSARSLGERPVTAPAIPYRHDPALRFYRLSQVTDDLFDAYRNAYLALECLVSGESSRVKRGSDWESELNWLKRVVKSHFATGLPAGYDVDTTLTAIYDNGRIPLFHAKQGDTFWTPQDAKRQEVRERFEILMYLLNCLFRHKLGHEAVAGWGLSLSVSLKDAMDGVMFDFDRLRLTNKRHRQTLEPRIAVSQQPRHLGSIWARVEVEAPFRLDCFRTLQARHAEQPWWTIELEEPIPLGNVATLRIVLSQAIQRFRKPFVS